jgi:hypothetical protein
MPTTLFQQLPWNGGLNTSLDEAMIPAAQLTVADNIVIDAEGNRSKREGINHNWDNAPSGNTEKIIGLHDYWYGDNTRNQRLVGVGASGNVYSYNSGTRTALTVASAYTTTPFTSACLITFNNKCIIAVDGTDNVMKMWDGAGNVENVPGTPPEASVMCEHIGRIVCNDKETPDMLHYSPTNDHTQWRGAGDSGAFPIAEGDGDPEGITALASWRGDLFVFKRTKTYRIVGTAPELMQIIKVSDSIGCVSQSAVKTLDQDDLIWVSEKGVHSMAATNTYGDFQASYVSADIQKTFNKAITRSRLRFAQAAYLPNINSIAFAFTEESNLNRINTTSAVNNAIYLYNVPKKAWYRWPDLSCQSLCTAGDADKRRFYIGTHTGRVSKTFNDTSYDITAAAAQRAIRRRIASGVVFVDTNPFTLKAFKRFILYCKPNGAQTIAATVKVDDQPLPAENGVSFTFLGTGHPIGDGFVLGSTTLGSEGYFEAHARTIGGIGRGCKIALEENSLIGNAAIEGFAIEWEPAGFFYEAS